MSSEQNKGGGGILRVRWVKSTIGYPKPQRGTIRALGLKKLGDVAEHTDTPTIRGMVDRVSHLVEVEEVQGE